MHIRDQLGSTVAVVLGTGDGFAAAMGRHVRERLTAFDQLTPVAME